MNREQEIELLGYMAKDLAVLDERSEGGSARVLNALLALYEVHEDSRENDNE